MKFVVLYPRAFLGDGGVTKATWIWIDAFIELGVEVTIVCDTPEPGIVNAARIAQVKRILLGWKIPKRELKEVDAVFFISGWQWRNYFQSLICRLQGIPYVVVSHGAYSENFVLASKRIRRVLMLAIELPFMKNAKAVHVFGQDEKSFLRKISKKINIIAIPTGLHRAQSDTWSGGEDYFAWVGRYDIEVKGLDILINLMSKLQPSDRPKLILHGRNSVNSRHEVLDLVKKKNLESWIEVCGPIEGSDKMNFLKTSKGLLYFSRWEGQGLLICEALSMGVPIAGTDSINLVRNLSENGLAVCFKSSEVSSFNKAIKQLESLNEDYVARALIFFEKELNPKMNASKFLERLEVRPN